MTKFLPELSVDHPEPLDWYVILTEDGEYHLDWLYHSVRQPEFWMTDQQRENIHGKCVGYWQFHTTRP